MSFPYTSFKLVVVKWMADGFKSYKCRKIFDCLSTELVDSNYTAGICVSNAKLSLNMGG